MENNTPRPPRPSLAEMAERRDSPATSRWIESTERIVSPKALSSFLDKKGEKDSHDGSGGRVSDLVAEVAKARVAMKRRGSLTFPSVAVGPIPPPLMGRRSDAAAGAAGSSGSDTQSRINEKSRRVTGRGNGAPGGSPPPLAARADRSLSPAPATKKNHTGDMPSSERQQQPTVAFRMPTAPAQPHATRTSSSVAAAAAVKRGSSSLDNAAARSAAAQAAQAASLGLRKSESQILRELDDFADLEMAGRSGSGDAAHMSRMYWRVVDAVEARRLHSSRWLLVLTLLCLALMVALIEADYGGASTPVIFLLQACILAANLACVHFVYGYYVSDYRIKVFAQGQHTKGFFHSRNFVFFVAEALLTLAMSPPFYRGEMAIARVPATQRRDTDAGRLDGGPDFAIVPADALDLIIILRVAVALRIALYGSRWFTHSARILSTLANLTFDLVFVSKTVARLRPFYFLLFAAGPVVVAVVYALLVVERGTHSMGMTPVDSAWLTFVTMIGLGYGEFWPETYAGRTLAVIGAFTGVMGLALLVAFVAERLRLVPSEERVVDLLERNRSLHLLRQCAAGAIQAAVRYRLARNSLGSTHVPVDLPSTQRRLLRLELSMYLAVSRFRDRARMHGRVLEVFDKDSIVEDVSGDMDSLVGRVAEIKGSVAQLRIGDAARFDVLEAALERHGVWMRWHRMGLAEGRTPGEIVRDGDAGSGNRDGGNQGANPGRSSAWAMATLAAVQREARAALEDVEANLAAFERRFEAAAAKRKERIADIVTRAVAKSISAAR